MTFPASSKIWVMPSFFPMIPFFIWFATDSMLTMETGSFSSMIFSMIPSSFKSFAVHFMTAAASSALFPSFQRMDANPSGDRMEYMEFSSIHTWLATARARAPPLPPSPMTMDKTGTFREDISKRLRAMASPCPLSSASIPQNAPGVSTKQMMGR